jgi:tetratricopeptide (TPR) repeat protein
MPRCHYFWTLILVFTSCFFFKRQNEFQRGLEFYKRGDFEQAAGKFTRFSAKRAQNDTVLYYLFDCYQRLHEPEKGIGVLEELVKRNSSDVNIYLHLFRYRRQRSDFSGMCGILEKLRPSMRTRFNAEFPLTRQLLAELTCGAAQTGSGIDPVSYAVEQGLLFRFPDGNLYVQDTLTSGNLVIALDSKLSPFYPQHFYAVPAISSPSFLYLPYMRLVEYGILPMDSDLKPDAPAPLMNAFDAINGLRERGLIK